MDLIFHQYFAFIITKHPLKRGRLLVSPSVTYAYAASATAATEFAKLNISLNIRPITRIFGSYNL